MKLTQKQRTKLRRDMDVAFSKRIRARDGRCRVPDCDTGHVLQCAHIVSRRYLRVRYDDDNAVALCLGHHKKFTEDPLRWDEFVTSHLMTPTQYEELKTRALRGPELDWEGTAERLEVSV